MESKTIHPNDKAEAMASENYEIYKREVIRLVFPRIFRESNEANTKAKLAVGAKRVGRLPHRVVVRSRHLSEVQMYPRPPSLG
ncbi:hypothetical protein [Thermoactinomyces sp. DSM 45892]|uniref:hypothetical protein n=1 Tax=Thermoactinomyces sp. DSM 45892 TaxID=1882753 RepID=UPI00089D9BDA|nr:hypothetical protein [Thermoactinomyces sp. DSM 45892]SDY09970.1 hypothetical protein SAMN05444416_1021 [Thermoactinomyces sp. DSM 45892]